MQKDTFLDIVCEQASADLMEKMAAVSPGRSAGGFLQDALPILAAIFPSIFGSFQQPQDEPSKYITPAIPSSGGRSRRGPIRMGPDPAEWSNYARASQKQMEQDFTGQVSDKYYRAMKDIERRHNYGGPSLGDTYKGVASGKIQDMTPDGKGGYKAKV